METALHELEIRFTRQRQAGGVACRFCRQEYPTLIAADIRHTLMGDYGGRGMCIGQYLTRNHVTYYRREGDLEGLRRAVARARELWGHRQDTDWLDEAEAEAAEPIDLFDLLD